MPDVQPPVDRVQRISPYGMRGGRFHHGIDLFAAPGTPVYAVADGVVQASVASGTVGYARYGETVILRHREGWLTLYAHMANRMVRTGEYVARGQQVGTVGTSAGTAADPTATFRTSAPHLHFEAIRQYPASAGGPNIEGAPVRSQDPQEWFRERGVDILGGIRAAQPWLLLGVLAAGAWWLWRKG